MRVDIYKKGVFGLKHVEAPKKITAIVPNYNYADFIIERIDSILFQTYPVHQLIVLDDASTDNSVEVIETKLKNVKKEYPNIEINFIKNEINSGGCVFSQWQKGIKEAKGDYVWIAEADDSADKNFLKTAMEKFERYPKAVLFYSDSYRINQNNVVISKTNADWADMWQKGRWKKDFYNDGKDEIINYLGETNPILNVSSVVWKNQKGLSEIFDEAKQFKVAGDWYIYTRVLENGDIVYSAKPLNYYRKHDKGSASTIVKLSTEYKEIVAVQDRVAKKYNLSKENLEWQKVRRRGMGMVENENNNGKKGKIAWFVPDFSKGSGGHRTIFQNANMLIDHGYMCDLYVKTAHPKMPVEIYNDITNWYGKYKGDVFNDFNLTKDYDIVIATGWDTAEAASNTDCKHKLYFIQDYEPWFFPMGLQHLEAESSYKYDLKGVSIGNWLPVKLKKEHNLQVTSFSFGADLDTYKRQKSVKKEDAVCFIYQPGKPRRCADLGLKALKMVQFVRPETKIYLYGSQKLMAVGKGIKHLGVLSPKECNELYNKCKVGLCFSASNPSRIPFEMMAAGLPVVDLGLENNMYDLPEGGCLLAEPKAEAIATAILKLLDDEEMRKEMSVAGEKYMKNYPLSRGYHEVEEIISNIMKTGKIKTSLKDKTYKRKVVKAGGHDLEYDTDFKFKTADEIWRENLTIPQRVYLKIRYLLTGR